MTVYTTWNHLVDEAFRSTRSPDSLRMALEVHDRHAIITAVSNTNLRLRLEEEDRNLTSIGYPSTWEIFIREVQELLYPYADSGDAMCHAPEQMLPLLEHLALQGDQHATRLLEYYHENTRTPYKAAG